MNDRQLSRLLERRVEEVTEQARHRRARIRRALWVTFGFLAAATLAAILAGCVVDGHPDHRGSLRIRSIDEVSECVRCGAPCARCDLEKANTKEP